MAEKEINTHERAMFGLLASVCYISLPISGGTQHNFLLWQGTRSLIVFVAGCVILFAVVGGLTPLGKALLKRRRTKQNG